jgi:hypothetical protein
MTNSEQMNQEISRIVYVKTVDVADLPDDVQDQAEGLDQLYAVHDANGTQLALVAELELAYSLADEHDFTAVSVH